MMYVIGIVLCVLSLSTFTECGSLPSSNLLRVSERACQQYSGLMPLVVANHGKIRKRRVVGGEDAKIGEFPFTAALGYLSRSGELSFNCAATIISDYYVLTAAQCVQQSRRPDRVIVGHLELIDGSNSDYDWSQIETIVLHPEYSRSKKTNDIALIKLVERIPFTDVAKPVCLETDTSDVSSNIDLIVTGWGITSVESGTKANSLQKGKLRTMPLSQCNKTFSEFSREGISETQYCAWDPDTKVDSCQGDSGGPLLKIGETESPTRLVGIVSYGVGCATVVPGIYTRVASYVDWIESVVWPNGQIN